MRVFSILRSTRLASQPTKRFTANCRAFCSTSHQQASWGFIGLGQMGFRMAKNLRLKLRKGDELVVQDLNANACKSLVAETPDANVSIANTAREVAERSEVIITALPEPSHVKSVYNAMLEGSDSQSASSVPRRRLFIDCSTIDPMTSAEVAKAVTASGHDAFIDAPMSGGVVGAAAGTLTFMIGCQPDLVDRATQILSMMGKRVLHMGDPGSGLKAKLANNYLLALNNIATCEAMNMGIKWGLDPKALAGMINISTGKCWPSEVNNPVSGVIEGAPAGRGYEGGFGVALMNKDLKLALKAAEEFGVRVELGEAAKKVYEAAQNDPSCKGKDFSVVYRYLGGKE